MDRSKYGPTQTYFSNIYIPSKQLYRKKIIKSEDDENRIRTLELEAGTLTNCVISIENLYGYIPFIRIGTIIIQSQAHSIPKQEISMA